LILLIVFSVTVMAVKLCTSLVLFYSGFPTQMTIKIQDFFSTYFTTD